MLRTSIIDSLPESYPGVDQVPSPIFYLMGCRNLEQFCSTLRSLIDHEQHCPFCAQEFARRKRHSIFEMPRWRLIENEFPRKNTDSMLLIVPKRHVVNFAAEVTPEEVVEIYALFQLGISSQMIPGGGLFMRFGDPKYHVGTIEHLHINVVEPIPGKEYRPPLAKNETELAQDYARMKAFLLQVSERGGRKWLFSSKGIEETQPPAL